MPRNLYKSFLWLLRLLIYFKRGLVWSWRFLVWIMSRLLYWYRSLLGFRIYKISLFIKKFFKRLEAGHGKRMFIFFGRRNVLQFVIIAVAVILMIPHSVLYTKETSSVAGRKTVLYELVGPGELDFELEEISIDITSLEQKDTRSWKEGAVVSDISTSRPGQQLPVPEDMSGVSIGGLALTKPTVISGAALPVVEDGQIKRTEIVDYVVQPGDVIGSISQKFNISVATILWANDLSVRSYIRPGDSLKILPVDGLTHTVKSGDTVSKIARLYGAEEKDIVEMNKLQRDGADIVVGEALMVPGGEKPQAPNTTYTTATQKKYTPLSKVAAPLPSVSVPAGSGYLWPTNVRHITQYYGWRHSGLDIAGHVGSPLYASKSGNVIRARCGWNGGYGCHVIIDHGNGIKTVYAHASRLYVSAGESVVQGQTIAAMGSTGRSTGSHIHFEVQVGGQRVNPLRYIR